MITHRTPAAAAILVLALVLSACGVAADTASTTANADAQAAGAAGRFRIDVWGDNWFAVSVDGVQVGEDSVPITTERSFNSESFAFDADYPFTVAIEAKDFTEDATGLEYIGTDRQQMGDGGLIFQIVDTTTAQVVAVSDGAWAALVTNTGPLDTSCEKSANPETDCTSSIVDSPTEWTTAGFDDSGWPQASEHSSDEVKPKEGYEDIAWDKAARFIWGDDLKTDNTVLVRGVVTAP